MKVSQRLSRLLGSMPFAVTVLAVVAVAASVGSLVEQNQPAAKDVGDFGLLWAASYRLLGLTDVYHASWFLLLLAFLTCSTGLCVWRNTPLMWREWRTYKEHLAADQLRRIPEHVVIAATEATWSDLVKAMRSEGWRWRGTGLNLSAKKGQGRRAGYVLTHLAIVVISVGGLIDGNLGIQLQRAMGRVQPAPFETPIAELKSASRLGRDSGAFRGALRLAEGETGRAVSLPLGDGYLVRELPVQVRLVSFDAEVHGGGQPKDFVSVIEVIPSVGPVQRLRVAMNQPALYEGLRFYQSSFEDGGSRFQGELLSDGGRLSERFDGEVGRSRAVLANGEPSTLEATAYRAHNLVATDDSQERDWKAAFLAGGQAAQRVDLGDSMEFSLRDSAGQQSTQTVYLKPIVLEGRRYAVSALRDAVGETRFVRLPLDSANSMGSYRQLMVDLSDPGLVRRFTTGSPQAPVVADALQHALGQWRSAGLSSVGDNNSRPVLFELMSRLALYAWTERHPGAPASEGLPFVADSLLGYSHWIEVGRPLLVHVGAVQPRAASVLQVSEAPGAWVVYLGMAMLAIGVTLMVLMPERRLWIRQIPEGLLIAIAAHRPMPTLKDELTAFADSVSKPNP